MKEEINPCPVCGKMPKVIRDYGYEQSGFGAWCTIVCKPLIGKPHLKVEQGKSTYIRAFKYAVKEWNKKNEE